MLPAVALVVGPATATLYETGSLILGPSATLWNLVPVVMVAIVGLVIGIRAARRPPRWLGILAVITNGMVVLFYGFLLVFFGLGGSR